MSSDEESEPSVEMEMEDVIADLKLKLKEKEWEMKEIEEEREKEKAQMKKDFKKIELKKREADLAANKVRTEIVSLRAQDKLWKESSKNISMSLMTLKNSFDTQCDQVSASLSGIGKAAHRMKLKIEPLQEAKEYIAKLQSTIKAQEQQINSLNSHIRKITAELEDKTAKIERLSQGLEQEVERLTKPVRVKVADIMNTLMKEKAARAQERRNLADLWPEGHLMPTLLMKYRCLSEEEKTIRKQKCIEQNASMALSLEIRANMSEKAQWTKEYDDYGREFYQHAKTGETSWEVPEILSYTPPPGRDEQGNISNTAPAEMAKWVMKSDYKGSVYYQHDLTGEITYISPNAYTAIPKGRSREEIVGEASKVVLGFLKEKIKKHITRMRRMKKKLENPLTYAEKMKIEKEKQEQMFAPAKKEGEDGEESGNEEEEDEEAETEDLGVYQYDIETVEYLADTYGMKEVGALKKDPENPEKTSLANRAFLKDSDTRSLDKESYAGLTVADLDVDSAELEVFREIVMNYALLEEKLDKRLARVRTNMSDFSQLLLERVEEKRAAEAARVRAAGIAALRVIMTQEKRTMRRKQLKDEKREERRILREKEAAIAEEMAKLEDDAGRDEGNGHDNEFVDELQKDLEALDGEKLSKKTKKGKKEAKKKSTEAEEIKPDVDVAAEGDGTKTKKEEGGDEVTTKDVDQPDSKDQENALMEEKGEDLVPADGHGDDLARDARDDDMSSLGDKSVVTGAKEHLKVAKEKLKDKETDVEGVENIVKEAVLDEFGNVVLPPEGEIVETEEEEDVESDVSSVASDIEISDVEDEDVEARYDAQFEDDDASLRSSITYGVNTLDVRTIVDNAVEIQSNSFIPKESPQDMVLAIPLAGKLELGGRKKIGRPGTSRSNASQGSQRSQEEEVPDEGIDETGENAVTSRPNSSVPNTGRPNSGRSSRPISGTSKTSHQSAGSTSRHSSRHSSRPSSGIPRPGSARKTNSRPSSGIAMRSRPSSGTGADTTNNMIDTGKRPPSGASKNPQFVQAELSEHPAVTLINDGEDMSQLDDGFIEYDNQDGNIEIEDYDHNAVDHGDDATLGSASMADVSISSQSIVVSSPDDIMDTSDQLAYLCLYSGYTNLRIDLAPEDYNIRYSYMSNGTDYNTTINDDTWLTSSFFLSITRHRIDGIIEAQSTVPTNSKGTIGATSYKMRNDTFDTLKLQPLHSCRLVQEANLLQLANGKEDRAKRMTVADLAKFQKQAVEADGDEEDDDSMNLDDGEKDEAELEREQAERKRKQKEEEAEKERKALEELLRPKVTKSAHQLAQEQKMHPHTPQVDAVSEKISQKHANWKYRQLVLEVVRYQMQDEAIQDAYKGVILKNCYAEAFENDETDDGKEGRTVGGVSSARKNRVAFVNKPDVEIYTRQASELGPNSPGGDESITLDMESEAVKGHGFDPNNIAHYVDCHTSISGGSAADGNSYQKAPGRGIQRPIQPKYYTTGPSNEHRFERVGTPIGNNWNVHNVHYDPHTGRPISSRPSSSRPNSKGNFHHYNRSNFYGQEMDFVHMLSEFRGDYIPPDRDYSIGVDVSKYDPEKGVNDPESQCFHDMFMGNMSVDEIRKISFKTPLKKIVKTLPNFKKMRYFLQQKQKFHVRYVAISYKEILELYDLVDIKSKEKAAEAKDTLRTARSKYKYFYDSGESMRTELERINIKLAEDRQELPMPKEPVFPDLEDVQYVPKLPSGGGADSKGKKKKAIPSKSFKEMMEQIENGVMDGLEKIDFGNHFPSQIQQNKLNDAIKNRNSILDNKRLQETVMRDKMREQYNDDLEKREIAERKRLQEYEKSKKESRKINLKLECFTSRCKRMQEGIDQMEMDATASESLLLLHEESKKRFSIVRAKLYLERERLMAYIEALKEKLFQLLDSRRRALEYPKGAVNMVEFEELREQSEQAIRTLRFEIFDVKEQLVGEGVRLRNMQEEEYKCHLMELNRARLLRDATIQRICLNKILNRHKYEVLHVMEDLEKLKLIEADKDDHGLEGTVDDLGEIYEFEKPWNTPEIKSCTRTYEVIMEKIDLTDGLGRTAGNIQKSLVEVMSTKWNCECAPIRDSWIENSDYERSQKLYSDTMLWLNNQIIRLDKREHYLDHKNAELKELTKAYEEQIDVNLDCHGKEVDVVVASNTDIVATMKGHLEASRVESAAMQARLEKSVTDLSKECQKVREDSYNQQLQFDEKLQVLWSFVATLQASLQQLTAKMTIIEEDRDKMVITTKLAADKLRHQLRVEREHSSNLLFIIYWQKGSIQALQNTLAHFNDQHQENELKHYNHKKQLRQEIWEQVFCFTRLCTDVNALFEFFVSRLANLAGARNSINQQLHHNGAAMVLAAFCKSPKPSIRKLAARGLAGMGWDSYVETRILLWDCMSQWKLYKEMILRREKEEFDATLDAFQRTEKYDAIISYHDMGSKAKKTLKEQSVSSLNENGEMDAENDENEEFVLPNQSNMSLRTLIKQRRQWALRATRRKEGPNAINQKLLNVQDGVIPALLVLCECDGKVDWEIVRNASLALSVASYEPMNHYHMGNDAACVRVLLSLCNNDDVEIKTHAAIAISNICHKNESSQVIFGNSGAIPVLLSMCVSTVVDVQEASTAALSNLTCFCDANCKRVLEADGVSIMVHLLTTAFSENLLDIDQNDEVQANAAEMLANVSRYDCAETTSKFNGKVIDTLVLMCASKNKQVRRHAPLVLGNISQNSACRIEIGNRGGVESSFLALEDVDSTTQANVLWALSNMMWHPPNQERAGRFMMEIIKHIQSNWLAVKVHACMLLANMLYYNDGNRARFLEIKGALELLIRYIKARDDVSIVENTLRGLLSLSYLDYVSNYLGNGQYVEDAHDPSNHADTSNSLIPIFLQFMKPPFYSRDAMRFSLEIICNLCVHHHNRRLILEYSGIEILVALHNDEDVHCQNLSVQIIEHLEDLTPPEVLARMKTNIGLERMIQMASDNDPLVRAVACESIGEELHRSKANQGKVLKLGGIDALLSVIANPTEPLESLIPALWSLRNAVANSYEAQTQFEYRDGVKVVLAVIGRGYTGAFSKQIDKVLSAVLTLLVCAIKEHEHNSRKLLLLGLEVLMDISEGKCTKTLGANVDKYIIKALQSEGIIDVAKDILRMLGPYNYIVCRTCHKKQNLSGTSCIACGNRLLI